MTVGKVIKVYGLEEAIVSKMYLMTGISGSGKTTFARDFARKIISVILILIIFILPLLAMKTLINTSLMFG